MSNITDIGYIGDISTDISDILIPGYGGSHEEAVDGAETNKKKRKKRELTHDRPIICHNNK